jgi:hypothetical protein
MEFLTSTSLEAAVHLIQVALTPVFLLSGVAALLNVFAGRLARVADRLDQLTPLLAAGGPASERTAHEVAMLHRRSVVLDAAVILGTIAAAATCLSILTLFLLGLSNSTIAGVLLFFFGLAIICTLGSVAAFGFEMLVSNRGLRFRLLPHLPSRVADPPEA